MSHALEDALRQALHAPAAPADLREGLLAAARSQDRARAARRTRHAVQVGLAAAMVLALGVGGTWLKVRTGGGSAAVAQEVLRDFMAVHALEADGASGPEGHELGACSMGCPGDGASLPNACAREDVRGRRGCRLKGMSATCYLLRDGRSLYVFPRPIQGAGTLQGQPLAVVANYQAKAWNEDGRGYVMVMAR